MSILIKGMDMPKADHELLCINIYPDGKVCINLDLDCKQVATAAPFVGHDSVEGEDSCQPCRFFRYEETEEPCSICCHGGGFKTNGALSYYREADDEKLS